MPAPAPARSLRVGTAVTHQCRHAHTQVALLFLAKGPIQTEPIWTAFIASAAELELRKAVPPARPAQPDMFPEVPRSQEEVDAKCWAHGGMAVPLVVPPRPQYAGAQPARSAASLRLQSAAAAA